MGVIRELSPNEQISDIEHCKKMIAEQERQASEAPTPEAAESHRQLIMLYTAQFNILNRRSVTQNVRIS